MLYSLLLKKQNKTKLSLILPTTQPFYSLPNFLEDSFKHVLRAMIEHPQSCGQLWLTGEGWPLFWA